MANENEDILLTVKEVGRKLRVSERAVLGMIYRGDFPNVFKAGRAWRIPRSDLRDYIKRQRRERQVAASVRGGQSGADLGKV